MSNITYFETKEAAVQFLEKQGYVFDRHVTWALTAGVDFFRLPKSNKRAGLKESRRDPNDKTKLPWCVNFHEVIEKL